MKRLFFFISFFALANIIQAQIAKWLIEPSYDSIRMAVGIDAIITDSANTKSLWSYEGERLATTSNEIFDFKENRAVSTIPGTNTVACIFKDNGDSIKMTTGCDVVHKFPYFSCGKLLVRVKDGLPYRFVSNDGTIGRGYAYAYPYFNNYALCKIVINSKEKYWTLVDKNEKKVQFSYDGKTFEMGDVEFVSSVNDENLAIVVIKHKLYWFNGNNGLLSPVFASEAKSQAKLQGSIDQSFSKVDSTFVLTAKCGKKSEVSFKFDNMMRPISCTAKNEGNEVNEGKYSIKEEEVREYSSPLRIRMDSVGNLYGIYCDGEEMLPAQFEEAPTCFGNKAFVRLNGKYGMLVIDKDAKFTLKINDNDVVKFFHQKFKTEIRVDMPTYILSDKTYLDVSPECGIGIDKTSRKKDNTEGGNYVTYNCTLIVPEDLSTDMNDMDTIIYPVQVKYNGLKSSVINHKIVAMFFQQYNVVEDTAQRRVKQGVLTFVFDVKNTQADIGIFNVSVSVDTLSVQKVLQGLSTHYKYEIGPLIEGINNIEVKIVEEGCPPASFQFEVDYHKSVEKTETEPAAPENVTVTEVAVSNKKPKVKVHRARQTSQKTNDDNMPTGSF